ncbi:hypothetical protein [Burkholderia gladioli]|uniref:hypothetical protein n=1 Tax=Burkholderia gladioli TaxID=28095 RepID=UPI001641CD8D|nr:hypothetical protein [Burkholderia gladioli]
MNPWMKFLAAVLLFGAWLALVLLHFVPAQSLVDAIGYTLAGLGIYHATTGPVAKPMIAALVGGDATPATAAASVDTVPRADVQPAPASAAPQAAPAPTIQ